MEFNSIDQFLDTLEGPVESSGSFSLNLEAARKKLTSFQLPDPGLYPIFLVASAVASEARRFDVWALPEELRFEFDGTVFTESELAGLDGYLFASGEVPPRLQNLAIALFAAGELASSFEFRSGTARLVLSEGAQNVSGAEKVVKTRFVVPRPKKAFLSRFKDKVPDLQEVMSVCRFAPLSIRFNNGYPSWGWSFRSPVIHRLLKTEKRIGYPPPAYDCHKQEVESPGPFGGVVALVKEENPRDLLVVVHGVSHPIPIDAPHMEGVLWHDGLTRDLSCTQLVHNELMTEFLEQLKSQIADMVLQRVISQAAFRAEDRPMLEPLAEKAAARFREIGDLESADKLEQWVVADDGEDPDIESDEGYQAFCSQLEELEGSARGMALRARALELFLEQSKQLLKDYEWRPLQKVVARMRTLFSPAKQELESLAQALEAINQGKKLEIERAQMKPEDTWQEGLVALLTGDWESAEEHLMAAAAAFPKEANTVLAHAYLSRNDPRLALKAAEKALESASSLERFLAEQPGKKAEIERHRERNAGFRDLVSDCLVAFGRPFEALNLRVEALPAEPKDLKLQALRVKEIWRLGKGQWPFWKTLKWHMRAISADWKAEEKANPYYCPSWQREKMEACWERLEGFLSHRPQSLDLDALFDPRFTDNERTKYYLGCVAREMRLRGEGRRAERLVARLALIDRAKALTQRIVYGAKEG